MNVLGIAQTNHGSAAALYDGHRLVAASEERFDRIKFSSGFPNRAIDWCLREFGADIGDVNAVAFYMTSSNYLTAAQSRPNGSWRYYPEALYTVPSELLARSIPGAENGVRHIRQQIDFFGGRCLDVYFVDHHLTHAAASFLMSGFQRAAILCLDGTGDGFSMSFARGIDNEVEFLYRQPFPHSLGQFYATFTQFIGFRPNRDEYKMMGLAAYGDASKYYDRVRRLIGLTRDGGFELDMRYFAFNMSTVSVKYTPRLVEWLGLAPNHHSQQVGQPYCDLAAAVQRVTEEVLSHALESIRRLSGESDLCYGGGVALNCLATGRCLPGTGFEDVYIPPNPGDGGLAIGACAHVLHGVAGQARGYIYDHDYLGPEYSYDTIRAVLRDDGVRYDEPADLPKAIAQRIAAHDVVAHFDGRQEFGPRALGNRSILADPRPRETKDVVNSKIKNRESFRPFAPSSLRERAHEIFDVRTGSMKPSAPESFMLSAVPVREDWRPRLQAVTHQDGTARVQAVFAEKNQKYYDIIKAFEAETGVPVLLNTSFNVNDEPIVLTPRDAIRCFYSTGIDALAIGPYLIDKRR